MNPLAKPPVGLPLVGIIMGSQSDWPTLQHAANILGQLAILHESRIVSAHRTPDRLASYAKAARGRGLRVIIAGAGGAAHLPGMCAAWTPLPILGVPVESHALHGVDSLLSIVQMPAGIPVATLAIGRPGAINAALLAAAILAGTDPALAARLDAYRATQSEAVPDHPHPVTVLLPNATIGIIGGGQLGRMSAMAAARLGYRVHILTPETDSPAAQVSAHATIADYEDPAALRRFAEAVDVVTFEFENVSAEGLDLLASIRPVHPSPAILRISQDRVTEKTFLRDSGVPTAPWLPVRSQDHLEAAASALGLPAVLKTARGGYDGKGQAVLRTADDLAPAWRDLGEHLLILEGLIDYAREISVIVARGADGSGSLFDAVENRHRDGILDLTLAPARIAAATAAEAARIAWRVAEALELTGLLAVEMFVDRAGRVMVNEIAPRPHNSGHWTIEACPASQFELHIRAIAGLPLPPGARHLDAVMKNLVGPGEVALWPEIVATPGLIPHLYGKAEARPGRKMGHVTRLFPRGTLPDDAAITAALGVAAPKHVGHRP